MDGSFGKMGSRIGMVLVSPKGYKHNYTLRFRFKATNNVIEYKVLLGDLRLAKEVQVKRLFINNDSQLIMSQVNDNVIVREKGMGIYLKLVMNLLQPFEKIKLAQLPCIENDYADTLSKLASSKDSELLKIVSIGHLMDTFIAKGKEVMWVEEMPAWMQPLVAHFKGRFLPDNKEEAYKLRRRLAHFVFHDVVL